MKPVSETHRHNHAAGGAAVPPDVIGMDRGMSAAHERHRSRWRGIPAARAILAGLLLAAPARGQDEGPPVLYSANRMLRMVGLYKPDAMLLGAMAEDLADRLQSLTGMSPAPAGPAPLTWRADADPEAASSRLAARTGRDAYGLHVELQLVNPGGISLDALLEAHVRSLLILTADRAGGLRGTDVWDAVPGWLAAGMYGCLQPDLRRPALARTLEDWRDGLLPDMTRLLSMQDLPPGSSRERAWAAAMAAWLVADTGDTLASAIAELVGRPPAEWSLWRDARAAQVRFDLWLARQEQQVLLGGVSSRSRLDRIREILGPVTPAGKTRDAPGATLAAWLARAEGDPLTGEQAALLALRLREIAVAADDELSDILRDYADALDAAARAPLDPAASRRLTRADARFQPWAERALARAAFLDRVEADWTMETAPAPFPAVPDTLRRAALRELVDRVDEERRMPDRGRAKPDPAAPPR